MTRLFLALFFGGLLCLPRQNTGAVLTNEKDLPFVERITATAFVEAEKHTEKPFSRSSELVLYHGTEDGWYCEFLIRRVGTGFQLVIPPRTGRDESILLKEVVIPTTIATQILAVFESLLTVHVFAPSGSAPIPDTGGPHGLNWLIFLRAAGNQGIAAVVNRNSFHANYRSDAAIIYQELTAGLIRLTDAHPDDRNKILTELDQMSAAYVMKKQTVTR